MEDSLTQRVQREKASHTERDVLANNARLRSRFAHIDCYPSKRRLHLAVENYCKDLIGKVVLDYGCGTGEKVARYLDAGAPKVHGMDISEAYIAKSKALCEARGYAPGRYDLRVMDAHNLQYEPEIFDYIFGHGILHHLDMTRASQALYRVLKPGGRMLFLEPLADNPLLRIFRWLSPHARTADEHPFTREDLQDLFPPSIWACQFSFCGMLEAPASMITSLLMLSKPNNRLLRWADQIETWVNGRRFLASWNQYVLLNVTRT